MSPAPGRSTPSSGLRPGAEQHTASGAPCCRARPKLPASSMPPAATGVLTPAGKQLWSAAPFSRHATGGTGADRLCRVLLPVPRGGVVGWSADRDRPLIVGVRTAPLSPAAAQRDRRSGCSRSTHCSSPRTSCSASTRASRPGNRWMRTPSTTTALNSAGLCRHATVARHSGNLCDGRPDQQRRKKNASPPSETGGLRRLPDSEHRHGPLSPERLPPRLQQDRRETGQGRPRGPAAHPPGREPHGPGTTTPSELLA